MFFGLLFFGQFRQGPDRVVLERIPEYRVRLNLAVQVIGLFGVCTNIVNFGVSGTDHLDTIENCHKLRLPTVLHIGLQCLRQHGFGFFSRQAVCPAFTGPLKHGVENLPDTHSPVGSTGLDPGSGYNQRNPHRTLVKQISMQCLTMVTQALTMITNNNDLPGPVLIELLKRRDQPTQFLIHVSNFAQVRIIGVLRLKWLGWFVGLMRIEIVNPHEKRVRLAIEPGDRGIGCAGGHAFGGITDKGIIVKVETPRQAKLTGKGKARNKSRSIVTASF